MYVYNKEDEVICFWKAFDHEMKIAKELNFSSLSFSLAAIPSSRGFQANIYCTFTFTRWKWSRVCHIVPYSISRTCLSALFLSVCLPDSSSSDLVCAAYSLVFVFSMEFSLGMEWKHSKGYLHSRKLEWKWLLMSTGLCHSSLAVLLMRTALRHQKLNENRAVMRGWDPSFT